MGEYCTYVHVSACGTPYYVGAGRLARARNFYRGLHNWLGPEEFTHNGRKPYVIIYEYEERVPAFVHEKVLIEYFGRMDVDPDNGTLYNRTAGPGVKEANRGPISHSTRFAMGSATRGKSRAQATKDKIASKIRGLVRSKSTRDKLARARTKTNLTHNKISMSYTQWARELGTTAQAIRHRVNAGWSPSEVVETPFRKYPIRSAKSKDYTF